APPELPGLIAALVWMTEARVTPSPSGTLRPTAETMPSVTLERSPSGLPRASTMSPTATCDESAKVAGRGRAVAMRITARSLAASRPTTFAGWLWPEASVTTRRVACATTCALVTTSPRASKTTPEPRSCGVRICTTDGATARTTRSSVRMPETLNGGVTVVVTRAVTLLDTAARAGECGDRAATRVMRPRRIGAKPHHVGPTVARSSSAWRSLPRLVYVDDAPARRRQRPGRARQ